MGRPPCCDKSNVKRGLWTPEEDAKILAYVSNHGTGNWTNVPKKAGLISSINPFHSENSEIVAINGTWFNFMWFNAMQVYFSS